MHSQFSLGALRQEEHRRMLEAVKQDRGSRMVMLLRHQLHRLKSDVRSLIGARRVIRIGWPAVRRRVRMR